MPYGTTNDPHRFIEAADWFRGRIPITKGWYEQLALKWRRYTFTVAGVAQLSMVSEIQESLHQAIVDGTHLKDWKALMQAKLEAEWAGSVKRPGFRASTIWRNNLQHAYNTGRWQIHSDPDVLARRPYWLYDAVMDDRTTPECIDRDGTILHHTHAWWRTNYPPNHHRCRAAVRSQTEAQAKARGIAKVAPGTPAQRGFGAIPDLEEWTPNPADFPQKLYQVWEKKLANMTQLKPPGGPPAPPTGTPYNPVTTPAPQPQVKHAPKVKPKPAPPPEPAPAPPPPPPAPKGPPPLRDTILGERIGPARGSNPGGLYRGTDDVVRYVKEYDDAAQAYGEHLANQLYRAIGLDAPESIVFELETGKFGYASIIIDGGKTLQELGLTAARAKKVLKGFGGDVLTANWDAVGMSLDNILIAGKSLYRVDNGGAFLMRARYGRKPAGLLNDISEWTGLLDPAKNPAYARVAAKAGITDARQLGKALIDQITAIEKARDAAGGWAAFVQLHAPGLSVADRKAIVAMLEARTKLLTAQKAQIRAYLNAATAPAPAAGTERFDWGSGPYASITNDIGSGNGRRIISGTNGAARAAEPAGAAAADAITGKWTSGYSSGKFQQGLRTQAEKIAAGKAPTSKAGRDLKAALQTRQARWAAAAKQANIPVPGSFRAYRGVRGDEFLQDVYEAWRDNATEMRVRSHTMASWSLNPKGAFGGNVGYDIDLPFANTAFDQIVDDSSFLNSFYSEHEVISYTAQANQLVADPKRVTVRVGGRTFTWADRADFIAGWEQRHGPGGLAGTGLTTP